jgi:nitroimidazol reductase NimA-like FMN-containing flavoprotein (pyridoxamine 5'-phosphate oxidase superfamily)
MTIQERETFLNAPHVGVLSVASDGDRPPLTVPIWYSYQPGGNITIFTGTFGRKARKTELIQKAGVLSLSVQREEPPYQYVTVEGAVIQSDQPPTAQQMLAIARRYLPEEHAQGFVEAALAYPGTELVHFTIRPDRWLTADFSDDAG